MKYNIFVTEFNEISENIKEKLNYIYDLFEIVNLDPHTNISEHHMFCNDGKIKYSLYFSKITVIYYNNATTCYNR